MARPARGKTPQETRVFNVDFVPRSPAPEEAWNTDRTRSSSGDRPRYDGPAGMEPEGLIDSNWDEVCENFDAMSLR